MVKHWPSTPFLGTSPAIEGVRSEIQRLAKSDLSIVIEGETGVGKELTARELHRQSGRGGALIAVNSAALPDGMFEAELFGYRRGAFTGAVRDHSGFIEQADQGTLFLDEVSSLPLSLQAKLLRVVEDQIVRPLSSTKSRSVNARFVVASNERLSELVEGRGFRADLYFRLAGATIRIPPLRDRREDIPLLAEAFLSQACSTSDGRRKLSSSAVSLLCSMEWRGNVRELRQVILRAAVMSSRAVLSEECVLHALGGLGTRPLSGAHRVRSDEREALLRILTEESWIIAQAAKRLGVSAKTIYARIRRFGISIPYKHHRRSALYCLQSSHRSESKRHDGGRSSSAPPLVALDRFVRFTGGPVPRALAEVRRAQ